jgi:hypothetical protein
MSNYRMELHGWTYYRVNESLRLFNHPSYDRVEEPMFWDFWIAARLYNHMTRMEIRRKAQEEIVRARNMEN